MVLVSTVLYSCKTKRVDAKAILNDKNITVEIHTSLCFGSHTNLLKIREDKGVKTLVYEYDSIAFNKSLFQKQFGPKEEQLFLDLIATATSQEDSSFCTSYVTYKIESENYHCTIVDSTCSLNYYYQELISQ